MKGHNWGLCRLCGKNHGPHPKGMMNKKNPNASFKKGRTAWNKGLTKENSDGMRRKSQSMVGDKNPMKRPEIAAKTSRSHKGKRFTKKHRERISIAMTGIRNHQWRGGLASEPYDTNFNSRFKRLIRERDNYICKKCGNAGRCVHHIDYDKKNTTEANCITLCLSGNSLVNFNRKHWQDYFENMMKEEAVPLCL